MNGQEIIEDHLSDGPNEEDPMLVLEGDQGQAEELSENSGEDNINDPQWQEVEEGWRPNWLPEYNLRAGVSPNFPQNVRNAVDYFGLFYDDEVLDLIVEETNRYATQFFESHPEQRTNPYYSAWTPCDKGKIKAYFGLMIHMGLVQYPRLEYHWTKTPLYSCSLCPSIMTRRDFFLLHGFLHFADNHSANLDDKIFKVRRLFELLSSRFRQYYVLHRELTIDERIVKFTGRLSFLQFIRNKPNQYGIKIYILADAHTGYVYNWKVYTGAEGRRNNLEGQNQNGEGRNSNSQGSAPKIMNTIAELTNNRGHVVCFDSYYCYLQVVQHLARKSIGCVATLDSRRKFFPNEIKKPSSTMENQQTVFRRNNNLMALIFKDKNYVRIVSNMHGKEFDARGRPIALRDYNLWARGVDLSNQMVANYHNDHKSIKWYKILALSFLETSISNAYILYKHQNEFAAKKHLNFREDLVQELLQEYVNSRQIQLNNNHSQRIIMNMHHIGKREQKHCVVCSTINHRKTSVFYCVECDENVCVVDCFYKLHTNLEIYSRNKARNI